MEVDPRVTSAVEHVQKATLELIAAMRNALDVAEDIVGDPQVLQSLFQNTTEVAKAATETLQRIRLDD